MCDVMQIIHSRKVESRLELVALAVTQSREGNEALANFVANRGQNKAVSEALSLAKEFSEAEERLARSKKSRVQILQSAYEGSCTQGCQGEWYLSAVKLLEGHGILLTVFATAIYTALEKERGKYQNIYIHSPANTRKTSLFYRP